MKNLSHHGVLIGRQLKQVQYYGSWGCIYLLMIRAPHIARVRRIHVLCPRCIPPYTLKGYRSLRTFNMNLHRRTPLRAELDMDVYHTVLGKSLAMRRGLADLGNAVRACCTGVM